MKYLNQVKKWPIEKKRIFAVIVAIFLTVLIIVFNFGISLLWKDESINNYNSNGNDAIKSMQESFSKDMSNLQSVLDEAFGGQATTVPKTDGVADQINSTTSSSSVKSNIVE